jgi:hypothetical protein
MQRQTFSYQELKAMTDLKKGIYACRKVLPVLGFEEDSVSATTTM